MRGFGSCDLKRCLPQPCLLAEYYFDISDTIFSFGNGLPSFAHCCRISGIIRKCLAYHAAALGIRFAVEMAPNSPPGTRIPKLRSPYLRGLPQCVEEPCHSPRVRQYHVVYRHLRHQILPRREFRALLGEAPFRIVLDD